MKILEFLEILDCLESLETFENQETSEKEKRLLRLTLLTDLYKKRGACSYPRLKKGITFLKVAYKIRENPLLLASLFKS